MYTIMDKLDNGKNPFMVGRQIPVMRKRNYSKVKIGTNTGSMGVKESELNLEGSYVMDCANRTSVFVNPDTRATLYGLSMGAQSLFAYIVYNIGYNHDYIKLDRAKVMQAMCIKSRVTLIRYIGELVDATIICRHFKQSYYWVNPFSVFNGNRVTKFKDNLVFVDNKETNNSYENE